jgi:uncharacterized protein
MISRNIESELLAALDRFPVVALTGPRQVGKTTLARQIAAKRPDAVYLDLERPSDFARIADAELYLAQRSDQLVILDEVQLAENLFPLLRSLVDEQRRPGRFLLLGSASPTLINRSAESLAGRIRYLELTPLTIAEVGATPAAVRRLWLRGGFPDSFLAPDEAASFEWRQAFVRTYLERDIPSLGFRLPPQALRRFWQMLAHWHGQLWNGSALAQSLGVSTQTSHRYLDILCDSFIARRLTPHAANLGKRLVKAPRIYLRDSGLLHALLNIADFDGLEGNPSLGASWEGFVIEQVLAAMAPADCTFFRTAAGAELDLVLKLPGRAGLVAVEVKYASAPKPTKGFWHALDDLDIERAIIVYPGEEPYPIEKRVTVWPAHRVPELAALLAN